MLRPKAGGAWQPAPKFDQDSAKQPAKKTAYDVAYRHGDPADLAQGDRAKQCRHLAASARDPIDRKTLNEMADYLSAEADKIDAEEETTAPLDNHLADSLERLERSQRLLKETAPKN